MGKNNQPAKNRNAFIYCGFRRGGSSISFALLQHILNSTSLVADDIVARYHRKGVWLDNIPKTEMWRALRDNTLTGCFRSRPTLPDLQNTTIRPITLIRDPRDCQLSWYHARYLHLSDKIPVNPIKKARLDEELVEGQSLFDDMANLYHFTKQHDGLILRYEDMVLDPVNFVETVLDFMKVEVNRDALDTAIVEANFIHMVQHTLSHNRSGIPHASFLSRSQEEQEAINRRFGDLVQLLGYPLWPTPFSAQTLTELKSRDVIKRYLLKLAQQNGERISEIARLDASDGELVQKLEALATDIDAIHERGSVRDTESSAIRAELNNFARPEEITNAISDIKSEISACQISIIKHQIIFDTFEKFISIQNLQIEKISSVISQLLNIVKYQGAAERQAIENFFKDIYKE